MPGVKVGDLAITKNCKRAGLIVEILSAAPRGRFMLPNGNRQIPLSDDKYPAWVIKSLSGPLRVRGSDGTTRLVEIGTVPDYLLFPLPGDPVEVDSEQTAEA
jgi:hypothetical protein